jgi:hypothetical protein
MPRSSAQQTKHMQHLAAFFLFIEENYVIEYHKINSKIVNIGEGHAKSLHFWCVRASRFVGRERAANRNVVVESHESRFDDMIRSQLACLRCHLECMETDVYTPIGPTQGRRRLVSIINIYMVVRSSPGEEINRPRWQGVSCTTLPVWRTVVDTNIACLLLSVMGEPFVCRHRSSFPSQPLPYTTTHCLP